MEQKSVSEVLLSPTAAVKWTKKKAQKRRICLKDILQLKKDISKPFGKFSITNVSEVAREKTIGLCQMLVYDRKFS